MNLGATWQGSGSQTGLGSGGCVEKEGEKQFRCEKHRCRASDKIKQRHQHAKVIRLFCYSKTFGSCLAPKRYSSYFFFLTEIYYMYYKTPH